MRVSRRDLLGRVGFGLTFLPALFRNPQSILGGLLFDPEAPTVPVKPLPLNPFQRNGKAVVAIVHGGEPAAMLAAGLELLGGMDGLPLSGKRVLIKPNVVNDRPPPTTTNPQVVAAVVRWARQAGAAEVVVADSSGIIRLPTSDNLVATGIKAQAEAAGARVLALEDEPWVRVEPSRARSLPHYYISKPVYDAEVFLNLPVVKTHRFAHYSCAMKNLVGITHPRYRPSVTFLAGDWHERIAELNLAVHPNLTIADATTVMIAGGPTSGTPAAAKMLLLSGDRIALDAVALALLRSFGAWDKIREGRIWEQRQIRRAVELGLGAQGPDRIEIAGRSLAAGDGDFGRLADRIRGDVAQG